jgi:hypothetical protein
MPAFDPMLVSCPCYRLLAFGCDIVNDGETNHQDELGKGLCHQFVGPIKSVDD